MPPIDPENQTLKAIFDKLSNQETNPTNLDDILTVKELQQAIDNNRIEPNSIHYNPKFKTSLLHAAVRAKNQEVIDYLLSLEEEKKIDVNITSASNNTALHHAAYFGDEILVLKLMDHGANLTIKNSNNRTPLADAFSVNPKKTHNKDGQLLGNKIAGRIIDRWFEKLSGNPPKSITYENDQIILTVNGTPKNLTIEDLKNRLVADNLIDTEDKTYITPTALLNSYNVNNKPLEIPTTPGPLTKWIPYTDWLEQTYGITKCSERGEKNTNKTTSTLYTFKNITARNRFLQKFAAANEKHKENITKLSSNLSKCYRTDHYNQPSSPAILLEDQIKPTEISYNDLLYQEYQQQIAQSLYNFSSAELTRLKEQKEQQQKDLAAALTQIDEYDNPLVGKDTSPSSRLDDFQKLSAETYSGAAVYKAVAMYRLSLDAFIAVNEDLLNKQQVSALKKAANTLMGSGTTAVTTGLKADANFVEFFTREASNLLEKPNLTLSENLKKILEIDANHLLSGCEQRLGVTNTITPGHLDPKKLFTPNPGKYPTRKIPRFFPDATGKSDTDEIILQTGGSKTHSTMVRIWKQPYIDSATKQTYYRFYRTEYNTGAGCYGYNSSNNTCIGTYTTEISGDYFDKNDKPTTKKLPELTEYNKLMHEKILNLIQAERAIMLYGASGTGPNGEKLAKTEIEKQRWEEQRKIIRDSAGITIKPPYANYRPQYSSKAVIQTSGNCTVKSQRQLLEDVLSRELQDPQQAKNLIQLHFAWAQGHDKNSTVISIDHKQKATEKKIKYLAQLLQDKPYVFTEEKIKKFLTSYTMQKLEQSKDYNALTWYVTLPNSTESKILVQGNESKIQFPPPNKDGLICQEQLDTIIKMFQEISNKQPPEITSFAATGFKNEDLIKIVDKIKEINEDSAQQKIYIKFESENLTAINTHNENITKLVNPDDKSPSPKL